MLKDSSGGVERAAEALRATSDADTWLLYDFRGNNDYLWEMVQPRPHLTRRCLLAIPTEGRPAALVHFVDKPQFPEIEGVDIEYYSTWRDFDAFLNRALKKTRRVAMEISHYGELPTASIVDGGFVDKVRSLGVEVVSSAALFQQAFATWTLDGRRSHAAAVEHIYETLHDSLRFIEQSLRDGEETTEYEVQQRIHKNFEMRGLETESEMIVAVNRNSADPHYQPSADETAPIRAGDWILIDLWAREPGVKNVYADVTWCAYAGSRPPEPMVAAFGAVLSARDAVVKRLRDLWAAGPLSVRGWELDEVAQQELIRQGYKEGIRHRTGHSIGPGRFLHALGVNIDNFETHDTRPIQPGVGFSVEPAFQLSPEFICMISVCGQRSTFMLIPNAAP
jgi:Xaa-Pro dipeptidase